MSMVDELCALVLLRGAPFVAYALARSGVPGAARLGFTSVYFGVAVACGLRSGFPFKLLAAQIVVVYGHLLVASGLTFLLGRAYRRGLLARPVAFLASMALFGFLGPLYPRAFGAIVTVLGWELVLSGYSYIVDGRAAAEREGLGPCLAFLLVNPVLVFPERGRPVAPQRNWPEITRRMVLGLSGYALHLVIAAWVDRGPAWLPLAEHAPGGIRTVAAVYLLSWAASVYLIHASVASLAVGWMLALGWRVPERYHLPFLASSPIDFWRRWNTYLGSWARRHVFYPTSRRLARRLSMPAARAGGLLATFAAVGAMHDVVLALQHSGHRTPVLTALFLCHGLFLAAWHVCDPLRSTGGAPRGLGAGVRWALFQPLMLLTNLVALPALAGESVSWSVAGLFGVA